MKTSRICLFGAGLSFSLAGCSSDSGTESPDSRPGAGTGGNAAGEMTTSSGEASGGAALAGVGGSGQVGAGGNTTGGGSASGGASNQAPVDCSLIGEESEWEVCDSSDDSCGAVFNDGAGCDAVCAASGLVCAESFENLDDGTCGADEGSPLGCDNDLGHQSDYCVCVRDPDGGTGETSGSGGGMSSGGAAGASGGSGSGGASGSGGSTNNNAPCEVPNFIFADSQPVGWASEAGGTNGGGTATPVLVTTLAEFKSAISGPNAAVIYVQGTFAASDISFGSNKTVIGCSSGAHIQGHIGIGSGDSNIIVRNVDISGYGVGNCALDPGFDSAEGCSSGADAVSVNGDAHHVWFDHCSVKDGTDGNLDITNDANYVTVSWTKFSYSPRTDNVGDDSTGASGHRYSNLVGGSNTAPSGFSSSDPLNTTKLNVTWHHNWWANNVVERMPRVRYGRNHLFNNLFDSATSNYCVRAGIYAHVLLEANYFDGVKDAHEFNNSSDEGTAFIALGSGNAANVYAGTSGEKATNGGGVPWTDPSYDYTLDSANNVPTQVKAGAGPQ